MDRTEKNVLNQSERTAGHRSRCEPMLAGAGAGAPVRNACYGGSQRPSISKEIREARQEAESELKQIQRYTPHGPNNSCHPPPRSLSSSSASWSRSVILHLLQAFLRKADSRAPHEGDSAMQEKGNGKGKGSGERKILATCGHEGGRDYVKKSMKLKQFALLLTCIQRQRGFESVVAPQSSLTSSTRGGRQLDLGL
eukprot:763042-Hanusia_phi.AAC.9